jgi:hypothetical protein
VKIGITGNFELHPHDFFLTPRMIEIAAMKPESRNADLVRILDAGSPANSSLRAGSQIAQKKHAR